MEAFMLDKEFLRKLDVSPHREVYARITSLTFDEQPIECIEGRITGGSVNIDGASSVRRTCSLSLVTEKLNINDYIWGIRTKFHLEVGLKNEIDNNYPDICWFNLGYYVTTSFTSSINTNSRTISIQGKDKMCLLNGDLGGSLPSIIDFGREEWYDYDYEKVLVDGTTFFNALNQSDYSENNPFYIMNIDSETQEKKYTMIPASEKDNWENYQKQTLYVKLATYHIIVLTKDIYEANKYYIKKEDKQTKEQQYILAEGSFDEKETYYKKEIQTNYHIKSLLIKKIIKEGVHAWAGELYSNIIINDLDIFGMEQLTYRTSEEDQPLFIIKDNNTQTFQVTINDMTVWREDSDSGMLLSQLAPENGFIFDTGIIEATKVSLSSSSGPFNRTILRVDNTEDAGYRITDLTYVPEDGLTSSVGEAFTSILDKIKNFLGDFEYFYNLEGQFIFQRKKTYTNVNFFAVHNIDLENLYVDAAVLTEPTTYDFTDNYLISAFNVNPTLNNLKNDYAIQGKRTTASGAQVPIHLRYAIDEKPKQYKAIDGTLYIAQDYYNEQFEGSFNTIRKMKERTDTGKIQDVDENWWNQQRHNFFNNVIKAYINEVKSGDNYFWDLHNSDWWQLEKGIFRQQDLLTEEDVKIDDENCNISYKAGWWDLEAWAEFYKIVTGKPANNNLVLYSGYKLNRRQNSKSWSDIILGQNSTHYEWVSPSSNAPLHQVDTKQSQRVFIIVVNGTNDSSWTRQLGTIKPMNINCANDILYETVYDSIRQPVSSQRVNPRTSITYSYPDVFSILPSWTCDLAVKKLISTEGDGTGAWIWNPQFPEGGFQEAFEEGFRRHLNSTINLIYSSEVQIVDWRELIYQMSKDYLKYAMSDKIVSTEELDSLCNPKEKDPTVKYWWPYGYKKWIEVSSPGVSYWAHYRMVDGQEESAELEDIPVNERLTWRDMFITAIMKNNPEFFPTGITGYEQYYADINGFWRQLYNPHVEETISIIKIKEENPSTHQMEEKEKWISDFFFSDDDYKNITEANPPFDTTKLDRLYRSNELRGWNYKLYFEPTSLDFWFDFLDEGEVAQNYSVKKIGLRTKAVNNDKITAVYFTKLPTICFYTSTESENWKQKTQEQVLKQSGYTFALLPPGLENNFTISSRQLSAKDELDNLLYQFSYIPENISITALPIYYLEPNTRIYVHDTETAVDGEYIVTKITLPLTYNGTMSITANKAPERIV